MFDRVSMFYFLSPHADDKLPRVGNERNRNRKLLTAPLNRNRNLDISTAPTKARSREPAYSQALIQNKIDRQRVRSRESGRQTVRRLYIIMVDSVWS